MEKNYLNGLKKEELIALLKKADEKNQELTKKLAPKKKKFDNIMLVDAMLASALKIDNSALTILKENIALLKSPADKKNYIAFLYKAICYISDDHLKALKSYCKKSESASLAFKALYDIIDNNSEKKAISSPDNNYKSEEESA